VSNCKKPTLREWLDWQEGVVPGDEDADSMIRALRAVVEQLDTEMDLGGMSAATRARILRAIEKEVLK
jgi:hypothetical protein